MEIVRFVEEKVLQFTEIILTAIEGGIDYQALEHQLKSELDVLGVTFLKEVLEGIDQKIKQDKSMREGYRVVRSNDPKELLTPFGKLKYKRTYYRHKETGDYTYLADQQAGITPHMRVEPSVKAELLEGATQVSYERATNQQSKHNPELKVSRQVVCNAVREFQAQPPSQPISKRQVKTLYLEADEDHISVRGKRGSQARLIYVHEGCEEKPRRHLKNIRHFTSVAQEPLEFWFEVCDYIATQYDLLSIEDIYLSGDGASWIRTGAETIPKAVFILDRFHIAKYIISATAHVEGLKRKIYHNIRNLNKEKVIENLTGALDLAESEAREKRISIAIRYIDNNWDGIKAAIENPHVRCSAEGHVSHVLSSRMSSRPMAWSLKGATNMACMLATRANKESVKDHYLSAQKEILPVIDLKDEVQRQIKHLRTKRLPGKESIGNIPLAQAGVSLTREALQGLKGRQVG